MKKWLKGTAAVLLSTTLLFGCSNSSQSSLDQDISEAETSKNLIILIGDGMGPAQVTLTRLYAQKYFDQDMLTLDEILVGTNSTFAGDSTYKDESGVVTDSAASATAFGTGFKTYNGAISVTNEEVARPIASVIEAAEAAGKATGLISTARITHATPAAYATHVRQRSMENAIAAQYVTSGVDVLLGGGERHFVATEEEAKFGKTKREDGLNVIELFQEKGYEVVTSSDELEKAKGEKLLGLFNDSHIAYNLDREDTQVPSLAEQLSKAIEVLEREDDGFVIMVEGGRIDHAGHANDIHSVVQETLEFDEAVKVALEYAKQDGETSVMVTADHETGGLTIGSRNVYDTYFDIFKKVTASSEIIGKELEEAEDRDDVRKIVEKYTGINDLTEEEVSLILDGKEWDGTESSYGREGGFNAVISKRALIGWTGHGHTGVDVSVYAYGPVARYLTGHTDNTDFALAGAKVIGVDLEQVTKELQSKYLYPSFMITQDEKVVFPGQSLAKALGVKIEINEQNATAVIEGQKYEGVKDHSGIYFPLEVFEAATGKDLTWDALSERIVIE
ncbi:alkaline phosphatase [Bacillus kexueae]|uniref:alkaline phosphatase n=1 Tax=Aeribacillus kexueae TaxID=2078952 RepID=UPI001FAF438B|nr:alkaline phosphatase [Bacillus kexueae]